MALEEQFLSSSGRINQLNEPVSTIELVYRNRFLTKCVLVAFGWMLLLYCDMHQQTASSCPVYLLTFLYLACVVTI
jgi:hypothetical protein